MLFATLPGTPIGAPKGIGHLLIVGVALLVSLVGVILCALFGADTPEVLKSVATIATGYLVGANAAARNNPPSDEP